MISGGLFTREFLLEGVTDEAAWGNLDGARLAAAWDTVQRALSALARQHNPNEAETEKDLIYPVLEAIGWSHLLVQQNMSTSGRADVPDALLFLDAERLARARGEEPWQRFQFGACVVEAKRWARPLDRASERGPATEQGVPSTQMVRYMRRADDITKGRLRWGILTNGRLWRLYWQGAVHASENYLEVDLGKVFGLPGCDPDLLDPRGLTPQHAFRLFLLMFGPEAFAPAEQGRTFHEVALLAGKRWEERVARDLSRVVFQQVFPVLTRALGASDPERPQTPGDDWLEEVRQSALILLYRLLFVLYAEDRDLLPDESGPYQTYALTRIRMEVAEKRGDGHRESSRASIYWARLRTIFEAISDGDDGLGVPPYNGGLFDPQTAPLLARTTLADDVVAEVVFALSHVDDPRGAKYVNYRDLSVQQLGSIYERILEFGLTLRDGRVEVDADLSERHDSGSFYTPEALVGLIVSRTVGPLVESRLEAFRDAAAKLRSDTRSREARLEELADLDPASALLDLKICDPAMGSGHFLVSLVEWLAVRVLDAMAEATVLVDWADYVSPLAARIAEVRQRILGEARGHGWPIVEEQLDDPKIVRRMILKRVVHGIDKNPMAVELAKVALWLHTFTVGAPLSFLDHHLRVGDSLLGAWVRPVLDLVDSAGGAFSRGEIARIENIAAAMTRIEETTDNDVAEVRASKETFGVVEEATRGLSGLFSFVTARRLLGVDWPAPKPPVQSAEALRSRGVDDPRRLALATRQQAAHDRGNAFGAVLAGHYGDLLRVVGGEVPLHEAAQDEDQQLLAPLGEAARVEAAAAQILREAGAVAARERFFHWPVAFPNLWRRLDQPAPEGGFHAVIGNPPYVRQEKLSSVKAGLEAYGVYAGAADLYVYFFEQALRLVRPGGRIGFVVNNKWLKAGYAEGLRGLLADPARAETDQVIDFGHARGFFPDADVFPCVVVLGRPGQATAPASVTISTPPRDTLPDETLEAAVSGASFPLARTVFTRRSWALEPQPVLDLLEKIEGRGVPLAEATGLTPMYGVKTGLNEAFLVDQKTRDRLISEDPRSLDLLKPYVRGQDVHRWTSDWNGLWMIFTRRGVDIDRYPAIRAHLEGYRASLEPRPKTWAPARRGEVWPGRKPGQYAWYEIQDPVEYWQQIERPKIVYPDIAWSPQFSIDTLGSYVNNTMYFLPTSDPWLAAVLNSGAAWWYSWRRAQRGKDDALRYFNTYVETFPIPAVEPVTDLVDDLTSRIDEKHRYRRALHQWLRLEFSVETPGRALDEPETLSSDEFVTAVRAAKKRPLTAIEIGRLQQEYRASVEPARLAAAHAAQLDRRLSHAVNAAYGLTPEDVHLMWRTAPPRMPGGPQTPSANQAE